MASKREGRRIKSVDTAYEILDTVRRLRGATVSELSNAVDLTPGTVHTHLTTLRERGIVTKDGTTYCLGLQLVTLGEYVRHRSTLYQAAKEQVDDIAAQTGECVHLFSQQDGEGFLIYESYGEKASGTVLHDRLLESSYEHLYCSGGGKAILAHLPDETVNEFIDTHGLKRMTPETITDRDDLFEELRAVRERGFALNDEELLRGQRAVGVPVLDSTGTPTGAISLSAPRSRLNDDSFTQMIPERLTEAVNVVELDIETMEMDLDI